MKNQMCENFGHVTRFPSSKTDLKLCFEPLAHVLVVLESSSEAISSTTAAPDNTPPLCNTPPMTWRNQEIFLTLWSLANTTSFAASKNITKAVLFSFRNTGGKIEEPPVFCFPFKESHRKTLNFVLGVIRKKKKYGKPWKARMKTFTIFAD